MMSLLHRANHCFASGAIAGMVTTILIWIASQSGAFLILGLPLVFELTPAWFYKRVVWGGMWGLLFLLPILQGWPGWRRGLVLGLAPASATWLFFNPVMDGLDLFGLRLGPMMPVIVLVFSLIWGALAGWWGSRFLGETAA